MEQDGFLMVALWIEHNEIVMACLSIYLWLVLSLDGLVAKEVLLGFMVFLFDVETWCLTIFPRHAQCGATLWSPFPSLMVEMVAMFIVGLEQRSKLFKGVGSVGSRLFH